MAETRLLSGKQCSVHFRHLEEFVARHPDVKVTTHEIFVIDGDAITCLPGTVAIDVAVKLIMRHSGISASAQKPSGLDCR